MDQSQGVKLFSELTVPPNARCWQHHLEISPGAWETQMGAGPFRLH